MTETNEFAWLDAAPPIPRPPRAKPKKKKRNKAKARREKKVEVKAAAKLDHEKIRGRAMHAAVSGRKRVWACDGQYVYFRRKSCLGPDGQTDGSGNIHAAIVRHNKFLANGDLTYIETQDDVEICRVNPQSALYRQGMYLGQMSNGQVQRAVVMAACKRDWPLYVDALTEFAGRIKGAWQHEAQAKIAWAEVLQYLDVLIAQRGGPAPAEVAAGMQNVRIQRGEGSGRLIVMGR